MSQAQAPQMQAAFEDLAEQLFAQLGDDEALTLSVEGEDSTFVRFNRAKVRQVTQVLQWDLTLRYQRRAKVLSYSLQLGAPLADSLVQCTGALAELREQAAVLPDDPFAGEVEFHGRTCEIFTGLLPSVEQLLAQCTEQLQGLDLAGIYTAGPLYRGISNSRGTQHWYQTETFVFDYSIYHGDRAVKGCYAGQDWQAEVLAAQLSEKGAQLSQLTRDKIRVSPGRYRCYLAPAAVAELAGLLSWGGFSLGAYRRGGSPLGDFYEGRKALSDKLSISEDYRLGYAPRFNAEGALAPERLSLIECGRAGQQLVSARSAREYGIAATGADEAEIPRSLAMAAGDLAEEMVLERLGTGLYISNLHYLNWSDRKGGRFTGMTRFACFWVEAGEIRGPIEDLRFDETIYHCLGASLEAVTRNQVIEPQVGTYFTRQLGATCAPGLLLSEFTFTL